MAAVVASVLIAVIIEPTVAVRLALAFAPVGLALGYGYRLGWSGIRLVTAAIIVSVLAKGIALMMVFFLTGIHPFSGQLEMLRESYTQAAEMYKGMGMNEVQIEMAKQSFEHNLGVIEILLIDPLVSFIIIVCLGRLSIVVAGDHLLPKALATTGEDKDDDERDDDKQIPFHNSNRL